MLFFELVRIVLVTVIVGVCLAPISSSSLVSLGSVQQMNTPASASIEQAIVGKGVLDRFEQDYAVILIEEWGEEQLVLLEDLPPDSATGTWFQMEMHHGVWEINSIDCQTAQSEEERTKKLIKQLREE